MSHKTSSSMYERKRVINLSYPKTEYANCTTKYTQEGGEEEKKNYQPTLSHSCFLFVISVWGHNLQILAFSRLTVVIIKHIHIFRQTKKQTHYPY